MHVGVALELNNVLLPGLKKLHGALLEKQKAYEHIIKIGRTHMMDATPLTLGQEFSGYVTQIANGIARVEATLPSLGLQMKPSKQYSLRNCMQTT